MLLHYYIHLKRKQKKRVFILVSMCSLHQQLGEGIHLAIALSHFLQLFKELTDFIRFLKTQKRSDKRKMQPYAKVLGFAFISHRHFIKNVLVF